MIGSRGTVSIVRHGPIVEMSLRLDCGQHCCWERTVVRPSWPAGDSLAGRRPPPHGAVTGERRPNTARKTQFLEGKRLSHYGRDTLLSQRGSLLSVELLCCTFSYCCCSRDV